MMRQQAIDEVCLTDCLREKEQQWACKSPACSFCMQLHYEVDDGGDVDECDDDGGVVVGGISD